MEERREVFNVEVPRRKRKSGTKDLRQTSQTDKKQTEGGKKKRGVKQHFLSKEVPVDDKKDSDRGESPECLQKGLGY